ncbi:hypothetical protein AFV9_gp52 [Betalipothrixvirus uzonense]|uniref:Tyrosine specific protein phosphatases domain-containing protein n=1 Tax=Betalipothrixvirus uzonense TaxID=512792 RepID=B2CRM9_9VIRU|nr:hypothetical protein AFV9_gp52 [Acidianus filamentous virus 9]ACB37286.1 hypothetical protein [Acidianus filamentous virus 9]
MGFIRHDPKGLIWQSDGEFALKAPEDFFIINVAKGFYNPKAKIWIPYDDNVPIDINDLLKVAEITRNNFENGKKTLIHCVAGVHRSVTFTLASIMYIYHINIREAMKMLCEPCIDFDIYVHEIPHHFNSLQAFYIAYVK